MGVAAIILAAGGSSRMQGANKLHLPVNGLPMIAAVVDAVLEADCDPAVVVTGHEAAGLRTVLAGRQVQFAHNPDWKAGMSGSMRAGLAALPAEAAGALIVLGDMPLVRAATLKLLVGTFLGEGAGERPVYPTYEGQQGNPVLFPRKYFGEMAAISGDRGAKAVLRAHLEESLAVAVESAAVVRDFDSQQDYLGLTRSPEGEDLAAT